MERLNERFDDMPDERYKAIVIESHTMLTEIREQNRLLFEKIDGRGGIANRLATLEASHESCLRRQNQNESSQPQVLSNKIAILAASICAFSIFIQPIWSNFLDK